MQILNPTPSAVCNGIIQGGYRIISGEGLFSLWRGMSSVILGAGILTLSSTLIFGIINTEIGPAHAVYFATYEAVKHLMGGNQIGAHHPIAAGL